MKNRLILLLLFALLLAACGPTSSPTTRVPSNTGTTVPTPPPLSPSAVGPGPSSTAPAPSPTVTAPGTARAATPAAAAASPTAAANVSSVPGELAFPIRAAFYYPWFPEAWKQSGLDPFTHYHPTLEFYDSGDPAVIRKHIAAMQYGKIQVGIASWWGQNHRTNLHVPALLQAGEEMGFKWALYMENEGQGDPSPDAIRADLTYIRDRYASSPAYLKVDGRFVVFVYAGPNDNCGMATRWKEANTVGAYVVLKVFAGYQSCPDQPDSWHQYAPANQRESMGKDSFTISPGFYKATEPQPRLERNVDNWAAAIRAMIESKADFQLITTFNEWGEGTPVEAAAEWTSPSGYGVYLDALHNDGKMP